MRIQNRTSLALALASLAIPLHSCTQPARTPAGAAPAAVSTKDDDAAWRARALAIAAEYTTYGRVDDRLRWAPQDCRMPPPPQVRMSAADAPGAHARKLYSVFARNHAAYPAGSQTGQVVVKEAWMPQPVTDPSIRFDPDAVRRGEATTEGLDFYPYAQDASGKLLHAGERAGLFLMFRAPVPASPGGEEWIYATIDRTGAVTAAGRIASCIACHRDAPHDGLFGLPK